MLKQYRAVYAKKLDTGSGKLSSADSALIKVRLTGLSGCDDTVAWALCFDTIPCVAPASNEVALWSSGRHLLQDQKVAGLSHG